LAIPAFDEFTKDSNLSRGLFRLGVVSVTQNWLRLFSRMFARVIGGPTLFLMVGARLAIE